MAQCRLTLGDIFDAAVASSAKKKPAKAIYLSEMQQFYGGEH